MTKLTKASNIHFSSATDAWSSPQWLFNEYDKEFNFVLDACATPKNAKCILFFTKEVNSLTQNWNKGGNVWCNPPYGRQIKHWLKKAYEEAINNQVTAVMLLPARTDTSWWHDYCMKGDIKFLRGRLKFGDSKNSAPFPNAIVIFKKEIPL